MGLALVVVLANIVVFVYWSAPRWAERWSVTGATASEDSLRQRIAPQLQRMRDTYGRLNSAEQDLAEFRRFLTSPIGGSDLLGMLNDAGDNVGIGIEDATFQFDPVEELGVARLGITLPVSGTYEAVRRLLDELLELPLFLIIDGIGLQTADQSVGLVPGAVGAESTIRIDLALSVFVDDPELAASAAPSTPASTRLRPGARESENLRRALSGDDAGEIADALMARLAALPPLPVGQDLMTIDMERLETAPLIVAPSRNLFATIRPVAPPPSVTEQPAELVEPEPSLPVRLIGIGKSEGRPVASLLGDTGVFVAHEGDRLPNGILVIDIGDDYAELEFNGRRTRLTLPSRLTLEGTQK
jgi:hypothetical protein